MVSDFLLLSWLPFTCFFWLLKIFLSFFQLLFSFPLCAAFPHSPIWKKINQPVGLHPLCCLPVHKSKWLHYFLGWHLQHSHIIWKLMTKTILWDDCASDGGICPLSRSICMADSIFLVSLPAKAPLIPASARRAKEESGSRNHLQSKQRM